MKQISTTVSLIDAYSILSSHSKNVTDIKAWKLGGTNKSPDSEANNFTLTVGYIRENSVYTFENLQPNLLSNKFSEFEFVVKLDDNLISNVGDLNRFKDNLILYLGIECPKFDFSLENLNGAVGSILKNCSAGELYVSEFPISVQGVFEFLQTSKDFEFIGLRDDPEKILSEFLSIARRFEFPIKDGQFVSLGGLTRMQPASHVGSVLSRDRFNAQ